MSEPLNTLSLLFLSLSLSLPTSQSLVYPRGYLFGHGQFVSQPHVQLRLQGVGALSAACLAGHTRAARACALAPAGCAIGCVVLFLDVPAVVEALGGVSEGGVIGRQQGTHTRTHTHTHTRTPAALAARSRRAGTVDSAPCYACSH